MQKQIILIITGSIAAYKSLELIRLLKKAAHDVTAVLTYGGQQFITSLSVASISENLVYSDVFSLKDESQMGHIRLAREADLMVVAPASADFIAKMAHGLADDLASTLLLATDAPVFLAPAMNVKMWEHPATQRNLKQVQEDGAHIIAPESGDLACGEHGAGRMAEPQTIMDVIAS